MFGSFKITGSFEIEEVDDIDVGTTIILHLKQDCREYADDERIKGLLKNSSKFVSRSSNCARFCHSI